MWGLACVYLTSKDKPVLWDTETQVTRPLCVWGEGGGRAGCVFGVGGSVWSSRCIPCWAVCCPGLFLSTLKGARSVRLFKVSAPPNRKSCPVLLGTGRDRQEGRYSMNTQHYCPQRPRHPRKWGEGKGGGVQRHLCWRLLRFIYYFMLSNSQCDQKQLSGAGFSFLQTAGGSKAGRLFLKQ